MDIPKTAKEQLAEILAQEAEEERRSRDAREEQAAVEELEKRRLFKQLKETLGIELQRIDTVAGMVAIKRVSPEVYDQFQRSLVAQAHRIEANKIVVLAAVVHPDPDTFSDWCHKFPAIVPSMSAHVIEFAGSEVSKKA